VAKAEAHQEVEQVDDVRAVHLDLHRETPRLGNSVIEMKGVTFGYEPDTPLLADVDLLIGPGDRLGIVGANGAGKSTMLGLIDGTLEPQAGEVRIGTTVQLELFDQTSRELTPGKRVREIITGDDGAVNWRDGRLMESFWFDSDAQKAPVELLSGGERRRLQLVQVLMREPNVLLLDEPTNDLDLDTLRVLEDFLDEWPGTLIVASHDRAFLERTVEDVVVLDGSGTVDRRLGGYEAWEADRRASRKRGRGGPQQGQKSGGQSRSDKPTEGPSASARSHSTLRHLMKDAEKKIAKLTKKRDRIRDELAVSGADHVELARLGTEDTVVSAELTILEDEWMTLAEEAESA
jgi:ATP-binding cassette subfamily F protein uup